jgi:rhodanese-related sulfurtransferase
VSAPDLARCREIRRALRQGDELALLDVRTEREHATGHPLFAASFPRQRLEAMALERLPRRDVPVVVVAATDDDADEAVACLGRLGFTAAVRLPGGLRGWVASGGELFTDVNAPSKAFGELVEVSAGTPSITAPELDQIVASGADVVIVDARTFEEHSTMTVPGSLAVTGGELVARVGAFAPSAATTIVVHCAGRTRSIIGAQSLLDAGVPNPVVALRNGTIGWTLAGFALEVGNTDRIELSSRPDDSAIAGAAAVAERAGVGAISVAELATLVTAGRRTVYRFDVRSYDEHVAGHPAGFVWAPGGQLVQETDVFAPVRGALIVLYDDAGVRAHMTGSWLAQMGWDVRVQRGDVALVAGPHRSELHGVPAVERVTADEVVAMASPVVVDVSPSTAYRRGHVPGACWITRRDFVRGAGLDDAVVVADDDGVAAFIAADVVADGRRRARVLDGGTRAWVAAGFELESRQACWHSVADDVYVRPYVGTDVPREAMEAYLDWEGGLVAQLERDGTHRFRVLATRS